MRKKQISFLFFILLLPIISQSQVGIGTNTPHVSAILELKSVEKGFLMSRVSLMSSADVVTVPEPALGLLVYNLNTMSDVIPGFYYWDGTWKSLKTVISPATGPTWGLAGNTASAGDFMGTVNYNPFVIKVNNTEFEKFHPGGGITIGVSASANNNNSIAIGTNANSNGLSSNDATAVGYSTKAGYRATAIGYAAAATQNSSNAFGFQATASGSQSTALGANALASINNTLAVGNGSQATGQQATALGYNTIASGQNATALGYQAVTGQNDAIVLGSSANANNKIGIGTNAPEERLHVVGSLKLVDGTQANGYILTSDANGKAKWQNPTSVNYFANIYYNGSGQTLNQYSDITFGATTLSSGMTPNQTNIQVISAGTYKITYKVTIYKSTAGKVTTLFNLFKNYSISIDGSASVISIDAGQTYTVSGSVMTTIGAYENVSLRSSISDSGVVYLSNGTSLMVELVH